MTDSGESANGKRADSNSENEGSIPSSPAKRSREKERQYAAASDRRKMYRRMVMAVLTEEQKEAFGEEKIYCLAELVSGADLSERDELAAMGYLAEEGFKAAYDRILELRLEARMPMIYEGLVKSAKKGSGAATRNIQEILRKRPASKGDYLKPPPRAARVMSNEALKARLKALGQNMDVLDPLVDEDSGPMAEKPKDDAA